MLLLATILADLPGSKPQRDHLAALLPLLVGLPVRPTHCNQAGRYEVVPYAHDLAWGQQLELLSVLDLEEHCSYLVNTRLGSLPSKMISIMVKRTLQHFLQLSLQKLRYPRFGLGEQPSCWDSTHGLPAMFTPGKLLFARSRSPPNPETTV